MLLKKNTIFSGILFALLTTLLSLSSLFSGSVYAREGTCSSYVTFFSIPDTFFVGDANNKFEFTLTGTNTSPNSVHTLHFINKLNPGVGTQIDSKQSNTNGDITFSTTDPAAFANAGTYHLVLNGPGIGDISGEGCSLHEYTVDDSYSCGGYKIAQIRNGKQCYGGANQGDLCLEAGTDVGITVKNLRRGSGFFANDLVRLIRTGPGTNPIRTKKTNDQGTVTFENIPVPSPDRYEVTIEDSNGFNFCKFSFTVGDARSCTSTNVCDENDPDLGGNYGGGTIISQFELCGQIQDSSQKNDCITCSEKFGVWTAVGCIGQDPVHIATTLVNLGLGLGGGIALLMILAAGLQFSISQGDVNKTKQAKELLTGAVTGLLFIIFSVMILQFIGYDLLRLPGFGV